MTRHHAAALLRTELRLLASRGAARAVLLVALAVGVGTVLVAWRVHAWGAGGPQFNGQSLSRLVTMDGIVVSGWALRARNFFVLPALLVLATASGFAGDREDRTLRDVLLQPLPRAALLGARLAALGALAAVSLATTLAPSLALGLAVFGPPATGAAAGAGFGALLLGYATSLASDAALVLAAATLSLWLRGTGSVVVALMLMLALDAGTRGACAVLGMLGVQGTERVADLTFARALAAWEGWNGTWDAGALVALAGWIAGLGLLVARRFRTLDVC